MQDLERKKTEMRKLRFTEIFKRKPYFENPGENEMKVWFEMRLEVNENCYYYKSIETWRVKCG